MIKTNETKELLNKISCHYAYDGKKERTKRASRNRELEDDNNGIEMISIKEALLPAGGGGGEEMPPMPPPEAQQAGGPPPPPADDPGALPPAPGQVPMPTGVTTNEPPPESGGLGGLTEDPGKPKDDPEPDEKTIELTIDELKDLIELYKTKDVSEEEPEEKKLKELEQELDELKKEREEEKESESPPPPPEEDPPVDLGLDELTPEGYDTIPDTLAP